MLDSSLSIRSPGSVAPRDVECEGFDITYPRIASDKSISRQTVGGIPDSMENDVDKKVDDSIEFFLRKLSQIGPELMSVCDLLCCVCLMFVELLVAVSNSLALPALRQGSLTLSFFERRASRQLFGLVSHEERIVYDVKCVINLAVTSASLLPYMPFSQPM